MHLLLQLAVWIKVFAFAVQLSVYVRQLLGKYPGFVIFFEYAIKTSVFVWWAGGRAEAGAWPERIPGLERERRIGRMYESMTFVMGLDVTGDTYKSL